MAGHLLQIGYFEIYRASITFSDVLLLTIWPELDIWKGCFGPQVSQVNNFAATDTTNLLFYL